MGSSANVCCDYCCHHPDYQRSPCSTRLQTCCTSPPQAWTGRRWRPGSRGKATSPGGQGDDQQVYNAKRKVFEQNHDQHPAGGVYDEATLAIYMEGQEKLPRKKLTWRDKKTAEKKTYMEG